ncbi:MAG: tRNA(Ser) Um(44) 2'-O-methyltransferase [Thelocarpon superellum]|nr:MAG: tRNA(Ser) Um(44) 2'-O-methyltransferase [Thelocarpon superellum]
MSATEPLFSPALISTAIASTLPRGYTIRPLQRSDYQGFLDVLRVLTTVGYISEAQWNERYDWMKRHNDQYYMLVISDGSKVVGVGTVLVERKFIHDLGLVGHIEDIAVAKDQQGKKLGLKIIQALDYVAEQVGCYKSILDCSEANEGFYLKCGFKRAGFNSSIFLDVMLNLIKNPNITSSHLFRADIVYDSEGEFVEGYEHERTLVRKLIPRNPQLDRPLLQTCHVFGKIPSDPRPGQDALVTFIPHVSSGEEVPWYHPQVEALAFLRSAGYLSIHIAPFASPDSLEIPNRLQRTLRHLLQVIHKHGSGLAGGYKKRTHHDQIIAQPIYQDTYTRLKAAHATRLINGWAETTDPTKHVFEDLGIAAFLIELWRSMYPSDSFPGFVDIGCGNGVLVDILLREGWDGHGVDARARKSWLTFSPEVRARLSEEIIVPEPLQGEIPAVATSVCVESEMPDDASPQRETTERITAEPIFHNGIFGPHGVFVISNHADELTGWTPFLAALSRSPFLAIPCCSHDLGGARFRAKAAHAFASTAQSPISTIPERQKEKKPEVNNIDDQKKEKQKQPSAYSALVGWIEHLALELGFEVQKEWLRIPSTRNAALFGRLPSLPSSSSITSPSSLASSRPLVEEEEEDRNKDTRNRVERLLFAHGGGKGWVQRALKLRLQTPSTGEKCPR